MMPKTPAIRILFFCAPTVLFSLSTASASAQGILTVSPARTASTVAGTGTAGYSGDSSAATSATLFNPGGAVYDGAGNLYVSDTRNNVIRKIAVNGTITTVAGTGTANYSGDGAAATAATLDQPMGLAMDANGNLYIADSHNHVIREVVPGGAISTVAGNGTAGFSGDTGAATSAELYQPEGVAVDGNGNLYIADTLNQRVREVISGTITTIAGTGNEVYAGDGTAATAASLDMPAGLAVDYSGNLYIADSHNQTVREISAGGTITTVAGTGAAGFSGDGGAATSAALGLPMAVSLDSAGNVYVADSLNNRVREVGNGGIVTVAGSGVQNFGGDSGTATAAALDTPRSVAGDASGNLAVSDTLNQRARLISIPVVSYGVQAVGTTSGSQTVTLSNTGTGSLTVSGMVVPPEFVVGGGSCPAVPFTLGASASCTEPVTFSPTSMGSVTGYLSFAYASGGASQPAPQVRLLGATGPSVLTVAVGDQQVVAGTATTTLSFIVGYGTLGVPTSAPTLMVNGSTANVGTIRCTAKALHNNCSVAYAPSSLSAGSYTISVTQPSDANYAGVTGTGTLTVSGTSPVIVTGLPVRLDPVAPLRTQVAVRGTVVVGSAAIAESVVGGSSDDVVATKCVDDAAHGAKCPVAAK